MKKLMVLILCCLLALSSAGCSSQRDDSSVSGAPSDTQSPAGPDSEQGKQDLSQLDVSKYSGFFGKYTTLTDQTTGVPVIDALLPYGWTAQVHSDWSFVSTSNPCIANIQFTSPDKEASVLIQTSHDYRAGVGSVL